MAAVPPPSTNTSQSIKPVFKRVQQGCDFDCAFACIATIASTSLDEVRQRAITQFNHPSNGPYWITEDLICKLFASYSFVCGVYKEVTTLTHLPDVCVLLVQYDPETEIGRHVVFVRDKRQKPPLEYCIDVAGWIDPSSHVRTDIKDLKPAYYLSIHPMAKSASN